MRPRLIDHGFNVYSQAGEDGVVQKIFETIGTSTRVCGEFGAWDGFHLSNTANLWTKGWKGVLIEASHERYRFLLQNTKGYDCHCIHAMVGTDGDTTLEAILDRNNIRFPIDFLSIDIDGDDYHVLASLKQVKPRVIACEFNPTVPVNIPLVAAKGEYFGCSAKALVDLAERRHYRLVAMTAVNCFFVREEEFARFAGFETSVDALFPSEGLVTLITAYDGRYLLSRKPDYGFTYPYRGKFFIGEAFSVSEAPLLAAARRLNNVVGLVRRAPRALLRRLAGRQL